MAALRTLRRLDQTLKDSRSSTFASSDTQVGGLRPKVLQESDLILQDTQDGLCRNDFQESDLLL